MSDQAELAVELAHTVPPIAYVGRNETARAVLESEWLRAYVARHVAVALNEAADEIESNVDWSSGRSHYGDNGGYEHAARIVRAAANDNAP